MLVHVLSICESHDFVLFKLEVKQLMPVLHELHVLSVHAWHTKSKLLHSCIPTILSGQ